VPYETLSLLDVLFNAKESAMTEKVKIRVWTGAELMAEGERRRRELPGLAEQIDAYHKRKVYLRTPFVPFEYDPNWKPEDYD
jgi:hypothetical protein